MSDDLPAFVKGTVKEDFFSTCRNCKRTADEHVEEKCLFEATNWDPMEYEEWRAWRRTLWADLGNIGADGIREALKKDGFARKLLTKK